MRVHKIIMPQFSEIILFPKSIVYGISNHSCPELFLILSICRWWSKETIAVVTGGNRGIGFEICRQLAAHGLTVILTSRDASAGAESIKILQEGGLDVVYHRLDIVHESSINHFVEWLQQNYGGLDILVNF